MEIFLVGYKRYRVLIFCLVLLIAILMVVLLWRNLKYKEKLIPDLKRRGIAYYQQGYFEEARSELQLSIRSDSSDAETYYILGKSYVYLGEIRSALTQYEKAVKFNPKDPELRYVLALAYQDAGQKSDALKELKESLKLFPNFLGSRMALVDLYAEAGDIDRVINQLQYIIQAGASANNLADVYVHLGELYFKKGQKVPAQQELEKALEIDPKNQQAQQLLEELSLQSSASSSADIFKRISRSLTSKIAAPIPGETLTGIGYKIAGTAQSAKGYITKVEVSTDGGNTWLEAVNKGANFSEWISHWSLPREDGTHYTIKSRATDNFYNVEYPGDEIKITVDTVAPTTIVSINPPTSKDTNDEYITGSLVILSASKSSDVIFYRWNNGVYRIYSSALKLPQGESTLYFYSKDSAGNVEKEQERRITLRSRKATP